jgi:hypothetical protein
MINTSSSAYNEYFEIDLPVRQWMMKNVFLPNPSALLRVVEVEVKDLKQISSPYLIN